MSPVPTTPTANSSGRGSRRSVRGVRMDSRHWRDRPNRGGHGVLCAVMVVLMFFVAAERISNLLTACSAHACECDSLIGTGCGEGGNRQHQRHAASAAPSVPRRPLRHHFVSTEGGASPTAQLAKPSAVEMQALRADSPLPGLHVVNRRRTRRQRAQYAPWRDVGKGGACRSVPSTAATKATVRFTSTPPNAWNAEPRRVDCVDLGLAVEAGGL